MTYQVAFTRVSRNKKTGPIPVTTSEKSTCPTSCPFNKANDGGCYAEGGPLAIFWRKVTEKKAGLAWDDMLQQVRKLPKGQMWRHNQAGDLAGQGDAIDRDLLAELVKANKGRNGFTYTHKPMTADNAEAVKAANAAGFTINLSANNPAHADELAETQAGPIVCVLPAEQTRAAKTPAGRSIAICPATISDNVDCASCGLCQIRDRKAIIGFPAHGASKRKASRIAEAA